MRIGILTVSDRASQGVRSDLSGPALQEIVKSKGWSVTKFEIVPDDFQTIVGKLNGWSDSNEVDLILTTGGTGFSPRDITPEATLEIIEREAPGLVEAMRFDSLKVTPHAMLSRARAGIRGQTLIVNLPGSPRAAVENLEVILPVIEHAVDLLSDNPGSEAGHHFDQNS
ncbi:MAG: molybdenum cofactor biosynthesis protein B [Anaerolineales bacterium]